MTGIYTGRARRTAFVLLGAALALCAVMAIFAFTDDSSAESGDCGANAHWSYDAGTLTITGTGAMTDWTSAEAVPWNAHRAEITDVTVASGITTIGGYAFKQCQMNSFVIPDTVTTLGKDCFAGCGKMTSFTIGSGVTNFSAEMMYGCTKMKDIAVSGDHYVLGTYQKIMYTADKKTALYFPADNHYDYAVIEDDTERIASYAFADTQALVIRLPNSIRVLEDRAFYNTASHQTQIMIGPNMEYVGSELFGDTHPNQIAVHLDFKGTLKSDFTNVKFYNHDGTECKFLPGDLKGKWFNFYDDRYKAYYTAISIKYQYADGKEAQPRIYEAAGEGLQYSYGTPSISGYVPNIDEVSGTTDYTVVDVTVVYSNQQYEVVYYFNGDEVMRSMEYFGYTVDVKPYEKGHVGVNDWYTVDVDITDGQFVMPDMGVYFSNIPIGPDGIKKNSQDETLKPMEIGIAVAVIAVAALMLLLTLRRH